MRELMNENAVRRPVYRPLSISEYDTHCCSLSLFDNTFSPLINKTGEVDEEEEESIDDVV